jgi:predicted ribosome quality control (RQC) complex YloA/Tae2 family protein
MENLILAMLIKEIGNQLVGSSVEDVTGLAPMSFAIKLKRKEHEASSFLVVCLDPSSPAVFVLEGPLLSPILKTPAETLPEGFVQSMCDRLRGAILDVIEQHDADRVVRVGFSGKGRQVFLTLWLELFGRRPNAVLVEGIGNGIVACSREGTTSATGVLLRSGEKYVPPSEKTKLGFEALSPHILGTLIENAGPEPRAEELGFVLSRRVKGLSPHAAKEIIQGNSADGHLTAEALFRGLKEAFAESGKYFRPAVRATASDQTKPPALVPMYVKTGRGGRETGSRETGFKDDSNVLISDGIVYFPTASEAVRFSFSELCHWYRGLAAVRLGRQVGLLSERLARLRALLMEDLSSAERAHEFRRTGELILANVQNIKRGSSFVELRDIHVDGQSLVKVKLDPSLSPPGNAQRYFKKAGKAERALRLLKKRVASTERSLQMTEIFRESIPEEVDATQAEELSRKLNELAGQVRLSSATGLRSERGRTLLVSQVDSTGRPARPGRGTRTLPVLTEPKPRAGAKARATFSPRTFETSDGFAVIVGRNNKENDHVTHHLAKAEDLWFHASGMPGSHVVLRRKDKSAPSRKAIEEAASIAAYFSKGRTSSSVPVIYTPKKYVHKPRGSRPGTATCAREKFIMVTPRKPKTAP